MQTKLLGALAASVLAVGLSAQATLTPNALGTGKDGVFSPTANTTLDTDKQACYEFRSVNIPQGVTVRAIGSKMLYIKCQGTVVIAGTLDLNGLAGTNSGNNTPGGAGGKGGAGGGLGGTGGASSAAPFNGTGGNGGGAGARGGIGGVDTIVNNSYTDPVGGGGGGGNATAGAKGGLPNAGGKSASGAGGKAGPCRGGGGGGGGGGDIDSTTTASSNDGGGGGGGGGGWVHIAAGQITIGTGGSIVANGGAGGTSSGNGGGGGGGAGGTIDLNAAIVTNNGTLSAVGGAAGAATQTNCGCSAGGKGGDGCINAFTGSLSGSGSTKPAIKKGSPMICVTESCCLDIQVSATSSSTPYMVGVGLPLQTPWNSAWGTVYTLDTYFILTLLANNTPPLVSNSNGTGSGMMKLCHPTALKLAPADVALVVQGITLDSQNNINGITNKVDVIVKL